MKKYFPLLILASAIALQSCATSYDKGVKDAGMLVASGDYRSAYPLLDELCKARPDGAACAQRSDVKARIGAEAFDRVKASLESDRVDGLVPVAIIAALRKDVDELAKFGYDKSETASVTETLGREKIKTDEAVTGFIAKAAELVEQKDRKEAVVALRKALKLDPERKASLSGTVTKIIEASALEARIASEKDDWKAAVVLYAELKEAAPDYPGVDASLADAQSKDNLAYYLSEGEESVKKEDFDRALRLYTNALNYPESDAARPAIIKTRAAAAQSSFKKGMLYYDSSQPYRAYQAFMKGQAYLKDIPLFSSNITFFLYKNLTPDIKVVEREAMDTLLKEYEVKTAGQMDDKSRENILSLLGADYLLFGDVLDYKVESNQNDTVKTVRAQTRTEQTRNPLYDDWFKDKEKGVSSLPPQPPAYIEKPVIEEIKYKVSFYKKTGLVSMSYRVVDTKGRLLNTSVVNVKEDVEDEGTDGVDAGEFKVAMKRASVPSDIELLRRVQEKAIQKIGDELRNLLINPEQKYLAEAERHEKDGELREAVERYSDVEIIYAKKGLDDKEIVERLGRLLDTLTGI
ncbi:MAG: hypothetical protein HZB85_10685 [Deltaproteobacteria bacterium]|nr:hypothetical protein [Deltaproteobacteria bacterium]